MPVARPSPYAVVARNIDPAAANKIHDDEVARRFGFSAALVPGVELFAYLTHPLVAVWGSDFLAGGSIDVSFRQPVHDGERVVATAEPGAGGTFTLALCGPAGDVRSPGVARRPDGVLAPDCSALRPAPGRDPLPDADLVSLAPGPLGSVSEPVDAEAHDRYLAAIGETLTIYAGTGGVVHPGALLRCVNALLVRNVVLGPWIHTGSRCRFLGVARVPTQLVAHGRVTDNYERGGHWWVRYDALVLADDSPVLHVDHTAIYRIRDGAGGSP